MCQHLSFLRVRQAAGIEPRSEPDSRNPTVRDRRGAYGNVGHGSRTEARRETDGLATEPYSRARHRSIPTTRESLISFLSPQGADQHGGEPSGESTARPKLPTKGPPLRRVDPVSKRGDDRYEGTSGHRKGTSEGR